MRTGLVPKTQSDFIAAAFTIKILGRRRRRRLLAVIFPDGAQFKPWLEGITH
jgi:hypothetical protein